METSASWRGGSEALNVSSEWRPYPAPEQTDNFSLFESINLHEALLALTERRAEECNPEQLNPAQSDPSQATF